MKHKIFSIVHLFNRLTYQNLVVNQTKGKIEAKDRIKTGDFQDDNKKVICFTEQNNVLIIIIIFENRRKNTSTLTRYSQKYVLQF